ncbi:hypothetical protein AAFF_G00060800 [Aldrovandia affinis]|uniref:Uncharacterized protein n=1 Tax=Aldrovandia affinis TaxID=143900 RepID=A0AAD7WE27_9TELE|nr:hypothetical protein AAFF_G00060800 [Aldrovandia affinis]
MLGISEVRTDGSSRKASFSAPQIRFGSAESNPFWLSQFISRELNGDRAEGGGDPRAEGVGKDNKRTAKQTGASAGVRRIRARRRRTAAPCSWHLSAFTGIWHLSAACAILRGAERGARRLGRPSPLVRPRTRR